MSARRALPGWIALAALLGGGSQARAQGNLEVVVEQARLAWTAHAVRQLLGGTDTIRLRIPGSPSSAAVRSSQAARLLADYLAAAEEVDLTLREVRYVGEEQAYAEFARGFTVRGTSDLRQEIVFLGFRRVGGEWRLAEVRITP